MHTPRLCIDGRAASESSFKGLVAQEVIDQLVSAAGEADAGSEWIEKSRTVLLAHPRQVFSGQLRRHETHWGIARSPLHWLWERHFLKEAELSAFHRFRAIDQLWPYHPCQMITTLLPPRRRLPLRVRKMPNHQYVVPSQTDKNLLESRYLVPETQVTAIRPTVRRYVHHTESFKETYEGWCLFLVGEDTSTEALKRLSKVVAGRFPTAAVKMIPLNRSTDFAPVAWKKLLQNTKVCFYLTKKPFDWPTLALESLFWRIPTIFEEEHGAIAEALPQSPLRLSRFLIEQPSFVDLKRMAKEASESLDAQGLWDPLLLAKQYKEVYLRLEPRTS